MKKKKASILSFKNLKIFIAIIGCLVTAVTVATGAYAASIMVKYDRMITKVDKAADIYIKNNQPKDEIVDKI